MTLDQLTAGTAYKVHVKAYPKEGENDVKESLQTTSAEVEVATKKITTPGTPRNFMVDRDISTFDEIGLKFDTPADDGGSRISGYHVFLSTNPITDVTSDSVLSAGLPDSPKPFSVFVKRHTTYYFAIYTETAIDRFQTPALLKARNEKLVKVMQVYFSMLAKEGNAYKNHKLHNEDVLLDTSRVTVYGGSEELSWAQGAEWISQNNVPKTNTDSVETRLSIEIDVPYSQVSKYIFTTGNDQNASRIESIVFSYGFGDKRDGRDIFQISEKFQGDSEIVFSKYTSTTD